MESCWAEIQADSFSVECRGCAKMKELEVDMERLRLLVLSLEEREEVGCARSDGVGVGAGDDKVGGDDERDARESSPHLGRRLRRGKVARKETGRKKTGGTETGGKATGEKEMGAKRTKASGVNATGAQDSQESGGKGDLLTGEREMDNMLPGDTTAGQNATEEIRRKIYSEVVIHG